MAESRVTKLRGVNLGGWLVLEKWITPSLFEGLEAQDETTFCLELGEHAKAALRHHWTTFITQEDFNWIAARGLNAVRIPVGHWLFGDVKPYVKNIDILDWAMMAAKKSGLKVVIDLHGAPGSQNGRDHSGKIGPIDWPTHQTNINRTLDIIERLAERYHKHENLVGIELLNEPDWQMDTKILRRFYTQAYARVRKHCGASVAVIIHDGFWPNNWLHAFPSAQYKNVILDSHWYRCFNPWHKRLSIHYHVWAVLLGWRYAVHRIERSMPLIIGEWSLAMDHNSVKNISPDELDQAYKRYGAAQLATFNQAYGWFFWTYKTESMPHWSLRDCVAHGWLPEKF